MNRCWLGLVLVAFAAAPALSADSDAATKTKTERLKVKTSVKWKDVFLKECLAELNSAISDADLGKVEIKYDTGVSMNTRFTFAAENKTVGDILEGLLATGDLTYAVISKKGDKYDGGLLIKKK
jgi:hypothetical protein